jgi:hypothetical protein
MQSLFGTFYLLRCNDFFRISRNYPCWRWSRPYFPSCLEQDGFSRIVAFCRKARMYIIVIAWIYVVFMMSITETTVVAGIMTFLFYGIVPVAIIVYLMRTGQRKRKRRALEIHRFEEQQRMEKSAVAEDKLKEESGATD